MIFKYTYEELLIRHNAAIAFGRTGDVKKGNRCAMVMGMALRLSPRVGQTNLRQLRQSTNYRARNLIKIGLGQVLGTNYDETITGPDQPFMERFFVKAQDLAEEINRSFDKPDFSGTGPEFLKSPFRACKGVIFLGDFWGSGGAGDHIDLWDGEAQTLNVTGTVEGSLDEIKRSKALWLWVIGPDDGSYRASIAYRLCVLALSPALAAASTGYQDGQAAAVLANRSLGQALKRKFFAPSRLADADFAGLLAALRREHPDKPRAYVLAMIAWARIEALRYPARFKVN